MANIQTDNLVQLIKSLSKSEKRSFKLYVNRLSSGEDTKFIQLFDALDKAKEYDESFILQKIPEIKKTQLSNLKAHLYKQLLVSLRLNHIQHNSELQIREQIDFAKILYNKGLYIQSLRILEKAKVMAINSNKNLLQLEILDFEKIIESQYITRSLRNRAEELTVQSRELNDKIQNVQRLSNLSLRLYGLYIKAGHVRNEKDYIFMKNFYDSNIPVLNYDYEKFSFFEKLYWNISHAWYNYIVQDFLLFYKYAQKWVNLFLDNPEMLKSEPAWYLKGLHNLMEALFTLGYYPKYVETLRLMEEFEKEYKGKLNDNLEILTFLHVYTSKINKHFLDGTFEDGLKLVPYIEDKIELYENKLDDHRMLVFYYKIACLHFGLGDNKMAIKYLNRVINFRDTTLREDIHCFARILNLIAHFELGNDDLVEYQIKSVYRFIGKLNDLNAVQQEIFKFLQKSRRMHTPKEITNEFRKLKDKLLVLRKMQYEKRPFLYLDIISWLESKLDKRKLQEVIKEKFELGEGLI